MTYTLNDISVVARELKSLLTQCAVFTFEGTLGAGKTTLVQEFLSQCGVTDVIQSPTFTYINTYSTADGRHFYHFDLYRLSSQQDFIDAGFYEYLYIPNSWAVIEWPEIIKPLLKHKVCHVKIDYRDLESRVLKIDVK